MNGCYDEIQGDAIQRGVSGPLAGPGAEEERGIFSSVSASLSGPAVRAKTLHGIIFHNWNGGMWDLKTGQIL